MDRDRSGDEPAPSLFRYLHRPDFAAKPFAVLGEGVLTYGALADLISRTAALFREAGVAMGDRIVICSVHDLEVIALYIAALRLGVTAALIDPQSSISEARVLAQAAQPRAVFADRRLVEPGRLDDDVAPGVRTYVIEALAAYGERDLFSGVPEVDEGTYPALLASHDPSQKLPGSVPDDTAAFILFTSGTTSRPKGVEATHRAVASHMATMHRQYGYNSSSRILNGLPLHHSDGINHGAVNALAAGATLYRTPPFSVQQLPRMLGMLKQHAITHLITVPTVLALTERLGDEFSNAFRARDFKFVSSTAGPLDERLWRAFEERFGTMVVNSYGLTETVCEGFYCGPTQETRRIGTIGKPIGIEVRLINAAGEDAADGDIGEIVLRGSCVMKGYYNAPDETAEVMRDGWLYTGDLAIRDADGFYTIAGRKKNVIIVGGLNVYPEDVSRTIARMPGVVDVVTFGVPDDAWGERVVCCVVPGEGATVSADDVVAYCRVHLSKEKIPAHVLTLAELPRGPSGKVALPQVREKALQMLSARKSSVSASASGDDIAFRVFEAAALCFKTAIDDLSPKSEPETTAGWNSLARIDFILALEEEFEIAIPPDDILSLATLGDAIALVRRLREPT